MAEEKKPKIDLKARLGKTSVIGANVAAGGVSAPGQHGTPVPVPPPPMASIPAPPGMRSASTPGVFGAPATAPPKPAGPPPPQRIEVDEHAVQQARKDARKQGLVVAAIASTLFLGLGFVAGRAAEQGAGRGRSRADAADLAVAVGKARDRLKTLATKMEAARDQLVKEHKFPDALGRELGELNIDFDGTQLAGRRFSGFPQEVTRDLVEFITSVQGVNDRKALTITLLGRLQKPLTELLSAPAGQQSISYVAVIDKIDGNPAALLAPLGSPIRFTPPKIDLPDEFTFTNPLTGGGNTKLGRYRAGDVSSRPAALFVLPSTFEKVCPSEKSGQVAQLAAQFGGVVRDIRGETAAPAADVVTEPRAGLLDRADKLVAGLNKVD